MYWKKGYEFLRKKKNEMNQDWDTRREFKDSL